MNTNQRISILFSMIAVSASLTSAAHARVFAPQRVTETVGDTADPVFDFNMPCYWEHNPDTLDPGWERSNNEHAIELSRCMLSGNQDGATFQCECRDNDAAIVGEIDREEILPEGLLPPVGSAFPPLDPYDIAFRACHRVLRAQCKLGLPDIEARCVDETGICFVKAMNGSSRSQGYLAMSSECLCDSGEYWTSDDWANQARPLDQEQTVELCQAELDHCAPQGEPGPSVDFFPPASTTIRRVGCMDFDEDTQMPSAGCFLDDYEGQVTYDCECRTGEETEGELAVDSGLSRAQLHDHCRVLLASECPAAPELPDEPAPKVPEDPDIGDIMDDLGCNLGETGPLRPWMLPGWALCLIAFRRRR